MRERLRPPWMTDMIELNEQKKMIARHMLLMFPPQVQESLVASSNLRDLFDLNLNPTLSFGDDSLSFGRRTFYAAVREAYTKRQASVTIRSNDATEWNLRIQGDDRLKNVMLERDGHSAQLPSFWILSSEQEERLSFFDVEAERNAWSEQTIINWRERIGKSALNDEDADQFHDEVQFSPADIADAILDELRKVEGELDVIVPRSMAYYKKLIGEIGDAVSLEEFVKDSSSNHIDWLNKFDLEVGMSQCLLSCTHSSISRLVDIHNKGSKLVEEFYRRFIANGDLFSLVAAYEIGISALDRFPKLEPFLLEIVTKIRDEDPDDKDGRLSLTADLCIFVDGELSRIGLFRDFPPFYRRLASIAQASTIERQIIGLGVTARWPSQGRGQLFYMQTYADLRQEPRWLPDLMNPQQLRCEFLSRISNASNEFKNIIPDGALRTITVDDGANSIKAQMSSLLSNIPGPLEGGSKSPNAFPPDLIDRIEKPLGDDILDAKFFAGVVNLALVCHLDSAVAKQVASILRRVKYRLSLGDDTDLSFALLSGLAVVAATSRTTELASEIRILTRVMRRQGGVNIDPDNQMRIAMVACAAAEDIEEWCEAVGDWLLEIAHEDIDFDMASALRAHIRRLCQCVPQLWTTCGKADAALASVIGTFR